jgi:surface antigen
MEPTMYKTKILATSVALSMAIGLGGCDYPPSKEQTGAVVGGTLGGVLGAQVGQGSGRTAAIIVGTLAGAMIGGSVGRTMDEQDRRNAAYALESQRTNQPYSWRNPDSGNEYTVTPTRTYETAGTPCREFTTEAYIDGRRDTVYGTACRQPDGTWQMRN